MSAGGSPSPTSTRIRSACRSANVAHSSPSRPARTTWSWSRSSRSSSSARSTRIGALARTEQHGGARGPQLADDAGDDVVDRQAVLERHDRDRGPRARLGGGERPALLQLRAGLAQQLAREPGLLGQQRLEVLLPDLEQARVTPRADRRRAPRAGEQRELADDGARPEHAQHRVAADHLQPAGDDDEHAADRVALVEQVLARAQHRGLHALGERRERVGRQCSNSETAASISGTLRGPATGACTGAAPARTARGRTIGALSSACSGASSSSAAGTIRPEERREQADRDEAAEARTSSRGRRRARSRPEPGCPTIATSSAMPSTAPSCRATEFRPVPVANRPPGISATAAPPTTGNVMPAPIPRITIAGSHSPT